MSTGTAAPLPELSPTSLRCMEVWGGSDSVDNAVSVPGIDAAVHSRPFEGGGRGGDIYYVSVCGAGMVSRFLLADVAGHGEGVGDIAASLRRLMRKHINSSNPSRLAVRLNEEFGQVAGGGLFATALVMTYFALSDHLILTSAGHPPPLWYQASADRWSYLRSDDERAVSSGEGSVRVKNLPLGVLGGTRYEQFAVPLGDGDVVVAYTDSLVEAADSGGVQLGGEGLLEIARGLDVGDAMTLGTRLQRAVAAHREYREADDDLTILVLAHNAGGPTTRGLSEKIRVLGRRVGLRQR